MPVSNSATSRLEQLTGLRFCAALGVVFCHYSALLGIPDALRFVTDFFGGFVALFFVLSGYVLTHSYARKLGGQAAPGALQSYFVARFARVMPMYWLCLFGILGLYGLWGFTLSQGGPADYASKVNSFVLNALALQAWLPDMSIQQYWNAPGWSISAEMFFYLCFPLLLRWRWLDGSRRSFVLLWVGMSIFLALFYVICAKIWAQDPERLRAWLIYSVRCPLLGLFCFALGVHLERASHVVAASARAILSGASLLGWAGLTLLISWFVHFQKSASGTGFYLEISAIYLLYTPFFYVLILFLLGPVGALSKTLSRPFMVVLGDASYALYLLHWLPLSLLLSGPAFLRESWLVPPLTVLGMVVASIVLFRVFENPLRLRIRNAKW